MNDAERDPRRSRFIRDDVLPIGFVGVDDVILATAGPGGSYHVVRLCEPNRKHVVFSGPPATRIPLIIVQMLSAVKHPRLTRRSPYRLDEMDTSFIRQAHRNVSASPPPPETGQGANFSQQLVASRPGSGRFPRRDPIIATGDQLHTWYIVFPNQRRRWIR